MFLKISFATCRPFCSGLNLLTVFHSMGNNKLEMWPTWKEMSGGVMRRETVEMKRWRHVMEIFYITGPLSDESTGDRWIPLTNGSMMGNVDVFFVLLFAKQAFDNNIMHIFHALLCLVVFKYRLIFMYIVQAYSWALALGTSVRLPQC